MNKKCCAIIGSRPDSFPWGLDEDDERCEELKRQLLSKITNAINNGMKNFAVAMDSGSGLYAAEVINAWRRSDDSICLTCIIPWEEQSTKWTPQLRARFFAAQEKCSDVQLVSNAYTGDCEITALLNAVDMADTVIVVSSGDDMLIPVAIRYMVRTNKKYVVVQPEEY